MQLNMLKNVRSPEKYSDQELIQKILSGEKRLFEILIRRNNSFLYKTGRSYNFSHDDTLDLMQDIFLIPMSIFQNSKAVLHSKHG